MAIVINIPDINTANFNTEFDQFVVRLGKDGQGATVVNGSLYYKIKDSLGNVHHTAHYTAPMGTNTALAIRNFLITNYIPGLKAQEGL